MDENLEFLQSLDQTMDRNLRVRKAVADAMKAACYAVSSEETNKQKAMNIGLALQKATDEIMEIFD